MIIDVDTRMVTSLGMPMRQSMAARLQNVAYASEGLNMVFFHTEVEGDDMSNVIAGVRGMNFAGCAVTKPNKVDILQYLDSQDDFCKRMGACNTIVKDAEGKLVGYNTDATGFLRSFEEATELDLAQTTFFCLGAGGASRAICSGLAYRGCKRIFIASRTAEKAVALAKDINENFADVVIALDLQDTNILREKLAESQVVINITGVGMFPHVDNTPLDPALLDPSHICFDAIYNPPMTKFLQDAQERGCQVITGVNMMVYQGAEQIKLWSGVDIDVTEMKAELSRIIDEKSQT